MEFTLLGSVLVAMGGMWLWTRRDSGLSDIEDPFGTLLTAALVGIFVGRVVAMIATGTNPISIDIILVRGGVSTIGASLGALIWVAWSLRDDIGKADLLAPAALAGLAGWHLSCMVRSSCLGAATDLPWGWSLAGSSVDRHPVEIYAAIVLIAGTMATAAVRARRPSTGVTALAAIGIAGVARLVTEPLRLTLGELAWFYGAAALVGFVGAVWLFVRPDQRR